MSDIYLSITETPTVVTLTNPLISSNVAQSVTVTNVVSVNVVTMPAITVQAAAPAVTTVAGSVAVSNFPAVTTVAGTVALDSASLIALENVTVTVGAAVTVAGFSTSSLPPSTVTVANTVTINGTVTANSNYEFEAGGPGQPNNAIQIGYYKGLVFEPVTEEDPFPISGTVTANVFFPEAAFSASNIASDAGGVVPDFGVQIGFTDGTEFKHVSPSVALPVSGTVTIGNSVTIGSLPDISGTVTANSIFPRVTFIDGSGTVATANTAITVFASSSTRSYLLVQVTTGSAFVNVGATATTVNGINLTAGQGYSWETTIPQGIVSLISTTTNSRYVAKEA